MIARLYLAVALSVMMIQVAVAADMTLAEAKIVSARLTPQEKQRAAERFKIAFELLQEKQDEAAKSQFEKGLEIDPADGLANYYLARVLELRDELVAAKVRFEFAAALLDGKKEGAIAEQSLRSIVDRLATPALGKGCGDWVRNPAYPDTFAPAMKSLMALTSASAPTIVQDIKVIKRGSNKIELLGTRTTKPCGRGLQIVLSEYVNPEGRVRELKSSPFVHLAVLYSAGVYYGVKFPESRPEIRGSILPTKDGDSFVVVSKGDAAPMTCRWAVATSIPALLYKRLESAWNAVCTGGPRAEQVSKYIWLPSKGLILELEQKTDEGVVFFYPVDKVENP